MKKVQKRIFRVYGARTMNGSKLHVALKKPFACDNIEKARERLYDEFFSSRGIKITDIALTFCTETYYEPEDRK